MAANTGGMNGKVTSCSSSTGNSATVHYNDPAPGKDETYENLDAAKYATFLAAFTAAEQTPPVKADVTCDAAGACTGVTAHR